MICQKRLVNKISLFSELNVRRAVSVKLSPQQTITIVAKKTQKPILYGAIIKLLRYVRHIHLQPYVDYVDSGILSTAITWGFWIKLKASVEEEDWHNQFQWKHLSFGISYCFSSSKYIAMHLLSPYESLSAPSFWILLFASVFLSIVGCPGLLKRWPCHSLTHSVRDCVTLFYFSVQWLKWLQWRF